MRAIDNVLARLDVACSAPFFQGMDHQGASKTKAMLLDAINEIRRDVVAELYKAMGEEMVAPEEAVGFAMAQEVVREHLVDLDALTVDFNRGHYVFRGKD